MTSFHKKYWLYRKNDTTEQIFILRITYTNLSILNQLCWGFYGGKSSGTLNLLNLGNVQPLSG